MQKLLKISLIISLLGTLLLIILSYSFQPKLININEINSNLLNQKVKISGRVISEKDYSKNLEKGYFKVLTIQDKTGKIETICSCRYSLKNKTIEVIGKVEEYKNKFQINADEIFEIKR